MLTEKTSHLKHSQLEEAKRTEPKIPIKSVDASYNYAQIIEKTAWQDAIRRAALTVASSPARRKQVLGIEGDKPSMSQLGGLRSFLPQLQTHQDSAIKNWFGNDSGSDLEKEKWKRRREKWGDSLRIPYDLVTSPDQIWTILGIPTAALTLTENGEQNLKKILWAEAVQTLVDAIIRAHKRDLEKSKQSSQGEA